MFILEEIKKQFKQPGNTIKKLIWVNVLVFLAIRLTAVFLDLFIFHTDGKGKDLILPFFAMTDEISILITRPWVLITSIFTQWDLLHLLFNMLGLYFIGQFFSHELGQNRMLSLYLVAGIGANILWFIAQQIIPYYLIPNQLLIGSSGAIVAMLFAVSTLFPEREVVLFFTFRVKLIWVAIVSLLLYTINLNGTNGGGELCHLGGAAMGYIFGKLYQQGTDITLWMSNLIQWMKDLFQVKPKLKVTYKNTNKSSSSESSVTNYSNITQAQVDAILDKLKVSGYASLSTEEKRILFEFSKK